MNHTRRGFFALIAAAFAWRPAKPPSLEDWSCTVETGPAWETINGRAVEGLLDLQRVQREYNRLMSNELDRMVFEPPIELKKWRTVDLNWDIKHDLHPMPAADQV
jgi:hypothetical protein